ncbi:pyrimidine/purine nucleoside phosphorylase [Acinetobacter baumannii]|nr:pyrimidine/purine nucleoside phosphorylase [Acinetobacter baumannii]
MPDQFDSVSITKKAHVYFNGASISRVVTIKDGSKKTIGVILPTDQALTFKTYVPERIEIISGECKVQIGKNSDMRTFSSGESFSISANSQFRIITNEVLDYICHFE